MIDLHCHLLPGIDDGPRTLDESLELCCIAVADGITHAIATPHLHPGRWDNPRERVAAACSELRAAIAGRQIPLHLGYACETRLSELVLRQVDGGDVAFHGEVEGYRIMLLEFPHGHIVPGSDKLISKLLSRGVRPLIAHPERNRQLMREPERIYPFLEAGCWLQLTGGSLIGDFGDRARELAWQYLEEDLVAVVASDGHNSRARPPRLRDAYAAVAERFGKERAQRLMLDAPSNIAASQFAEGAVTAAGSA